MGTHHVQNLKHSKPQSKHNGDPLRSTSISFTADSVIHLTMVSWRQIKSLLWWRLASFWPGLADVDGCWVSDNWIFDKAPGMNIHIKARTWTQRRRCLKTASVGKCYKSKFHALRPGKSVDIEAEPCWAEEDDRVVLNDEGLIQAVWGPPLLERRKYNHLCTASAVWPLPSRYMRSELRCVPNPPHYNRSALCAATAIQ